MLIDLDDQLWLERLIEAFDCRPGRLSTWELGFMEDTKARYAEMDAEIWVSPKQRQVLERIANKLL